MGCERRQVSGDLERGQWDACSSESDMEYVGKGEPLPAYLPGLFVPLEQTLNMEHTEIPMHFFPTLVNNIIFDSL